MVVRGVCMWKDMKICSLSLGNKKANIVRVVNKRAWYGVEDKTNASLFVEKEIEVKGFV